MVHNLCSQDPEKVKDPVEFVQQLLTQKDKFDAIVLRSFQNDKAFQNALNQAFEHFIKPQPAVARVHLPLHGRQAAEGPQGKQQLCGLCRSGHELNTVMEE